MGVIDMAADRGAYIDQSQSLNIHMVDATTAKLSSMHFHGWQLGLKTGMYYLRTKAAADAIKFTVEVDKMCTASTAAKDESAKEDVAKRAIEQLRAAEPTTGCLNCSALIPTQFCPAEVLRSHSIMHCTDCISVQGPIRVYLWSGYVHC